MMRWIFTFWATLVFVAGCVGSGGPPDAPAADAPTTGVDASAPTVDAAPPDGAPPPDAPAAYELHVVAVGGLVTSSPPGIDCSSTCSAFFPTGATVTLTATPTADFGGWSGDCTGAAPTCTLTMDRELTVIAVFGEEGDLIWANRYGTVQSDWVQDLDVDPDGNVAITGGFYEPIDLGTGVQLSAGESDVYVGRYTSGGAPSWSRRIGGIRADLSWAVAAGPSGKVVVAGAFSDTVEFAGVTRASAGWGDLFVAEYDPSGEEVWFTSFPDTGDQATPIAVAVDPLGNVVVAGTFRGTVDFGWGEVGSTDPIDWDLYVVKLSGLDGSYLWHHTYGPIRNQQVVGLALDGAGDVYLAGRFSGMVSFGGPVLTPVNNGDILLAKYWGIDGSHLWSRSFGGDGEEYALAIDVNAAGEIAIAGVIDQATDFGGIAIDPGDDLATYVATYDTDGNLGWVQTYQGVDWYSGGGLRRLALGADGNVFGVGSFHGTIDLGAGLVTALGGRDLYLAKYGPAGALWVKTFSGPQDDDGMDVALSPGGITMTATFSGSIDFGLGPLTALGGTDLVLARFAP